LNEASSTAEPCPPKTCSWLPLRSHSTATALGLGPTVVVTIVEPSWLQCALETRAGFVSTIGVDCPSAYRRTSLSPAVTSSSVPSGLNATERTARGRGNRSCSLPVATLQTFAVWSTLPVATTFPPGENASAVIKCPPGSVRSSAPVVALQSEITPDGPE